MSAISHLSTTTYADASASGSLWGTKATRRGEPRRPLSPFQALEEGNPEALRGATLAGHRRLDLIPDRQGLYVIAGQRHGQATLAFDLTRPFVVMLPPYSLTNDQCQAVSQLV